MNRIVSTFFRTVLITTISLYAVELFAQEQKISEEYIVTGWCTVNDIRNNPKTSEWFVPEYSSYKADKSAIEILKQKNDLNFTVTLVMGTWCSDSKEQVPRLIKVLDESGFMYDNMSMICVYRNKTASGIDLSSYNIVKVPTIILYIDEEEAGRIIETPAETIEKDLINILNNLKK